jgi:RNA 3'-phosphate cyclase
VIHIDGSHGEGGGQILRYSIALSTYTKQPITIHNIRAKRNNPGLQPQHLTAIQCMKKICNAQTKGLRIGSKEILFIPGEIQPDIYNFDIGTAGSICLVFQTCILALLQTTKPISIQLTGGTDVRWAPSWDYFTNIFLQLLKKIGITVSFHLLKRGFYPTGGGQASITIHPLTSIKQITFNPNASYDSIHGAITTSQLSSHIPTRIKHTLLKQSIKHNIQCNIQTTISNASSPGVVVSLWTTSPNILGTTKLGEKHIPSEQLALQAFQNIIYEIKHHATIDKYAIDQILPYLALTQNTATCHISHLSNHTKTTIWLLEQFITKKCSYNSTQKVITIQNGS